MYLGKADVNTYDKGAGREFLISNGRGSYGFSTVIGANTRREHGLLVVRPEDKSQHSVLVSKIEETIFDQNKKYQLSTNRYKDLVYPDGYRYLQECQGNPFPSMLFVIHSILLKKSIFMPNGKECTVIKYELLAAPDKIRLDLRPLVAHRSSGSVCPDSRGNDFSVSSDSAHSISISGRSHTSCVSVTAGTWSLKPLWFENLIYEHDDRPDSSSVDHLWSPGFISNELSEGDVVYVVLSQSPLNYSLKELADMEKEASDRFENILEQANLPALSSAEQDMIAASYHLVDDRPESVAPIYTGYPSVGTNARDSFISLPGLLIATGREAVAAKTLGYWLELAENNGWVMPDKLDSESGIKFGGADNGLWFVYAADKYLSHSDGKDAFRAELARAVREITLKYLSGIPELDLVCDPNMLLKLTSDNPARHWMGALAGEEQVVERKGYLVEINALWYNALRVAAKCAAEFDGAEGEKKFSEAAEKCAKAFRDAFWSFDMNGLYDCVDPETFKNDASIRPNQILAVSLPYSPLQPEMAQKVVRLCWNELYTTYGLRTLNPRHDKFKGRSEGRADQRLKARYRGMAWTWLLGQFITAYLKLSPSRRDLGWVFIRPFNSHLRHGCLGGVAELFDGMMPYRPHGDVLSAISLGELLRVLHENLETEE
ncbi:MAG: amylo-alpha-1,6-glucosidase [Synergistaceae bacterium]|nr:amylo-alpha-1,6-glucosidase [Synergistaceae bacterium]